MSGPRRRKFVGPIVSRIAWHGGRGRQRSRSALIIALRLVIADLEGAAALAGPLRSEKDWVDVAKLHLRKLRNQQEKSN